MKFPQMTEGFLLKILLVSSVFLFLGFGSYHISKFETVDEHFWKYERISRYWKDGILGGNLKKTYINDKPGVTTAIVSGAGLLFSPDPLEHRIRDEKITGNDLYTVYDIDQTEKINLSLRLPLLLINAFFIFFFYWIIEKMTGEKWIALLASIFIALSPILVGISQIINPDTLLWTFSSAAFFSYFTLLKTGERKFLFLTTLFTGLSILSKYTANLLFLFYPFIFLSHLIFNSEEIEKGEGVSKYITGNLSRFAIIFLGSLAIYALFLPAVFVKLEYLYEGTIGSPTLKSFSLPFTAFLLLLLADAKLMKANVTKSVSLFLNANQNTILRILAASFLGIILLLSLNSWTGERIIPLENIKEEAYVDDELLFPMIEGRNGLTVFVKKFAAQLYPLTFSLLPLQLILLVAMLLGIIAGKFYKFKSFTFFLLMFTFVYVFGALVSDVFLNPRYSIMLYPLYALFSAITIHGISVYFKNKKKFFISMSLLVIISGSVSLWLVKPFPFAYANFFLPKNQVITDSWGYGEYEAAQYLNSLPEAENIVIWSDLSGICQFFKGKCLKSYKIDLSKTAPDYFVFSRRGAIRHPFVWEKPELAKNSTSYYYGKIPDGFEWAVYVGGREDNFVKIIKVEEK